MAKCDWNVAFFNIEISTCRTALTVHANEEGISNFLKEYGSSSQPPEVIFLSKISRPERRWNSWKIKDNETFVLEDPTPFIATYYVSVLNTPAPVLRIKFVEESAEPILCAALSNKIPTLTVNKQGWQKFLSALRCLRDHAYWFYITVVNDGWEHLPFQLTTPYRGPPEDEPFLGIEFIRTIPEEKMCLLLYLNYDEILADQKYTTQENIDNHCIFLSLDLGGNALGLLTFSQWIKEFAESDEIEKSFVNKWIDFVHKKGKPILEDKYIVLKKLTEKKSKPVLSFEFLHEQPHHLYIFANDEGFYCFAKKLASYAFAPDYDNSDFEIERRTVDLLNDDYIAFNGYRIHGGGYFYPKYNPLFAVQFNDKLLPQEADFQRYLICRNFINERVILHYDDTSAST